MAGYVKNQDRNPDHYLDRPKKMAAVVKAKLVAMLDHEPNFAESITIKAMVLQVVELIQLYDKATKTGKMPAKADRLIANMRANMTLLYGVSLGEPSRIPKRSRRDEAPREIAGIDFSELL